MRSMVRLRLFVFVGLAGGIFSFATEVVWGQGTKMPASPARRVVGPESAPGKADVDGKPTRAPLPAPAAPPAKYDPRLIKVLNMWELESAKIKKLKGTFKRQTFDVVWGIERRATGTFYYEAPDKGTYTVGGETIPKGTVGTRKLPSGDPFQVQKDIDERWICDGKQVMQLNDADKTYDIARLPPDQQGENIIEGPLPFLFGMKTKQALARFKLELRKETETEVILSARPLRQNDAANYREATIILLKPQYLPKAVRLLDPSGNKETQHWFEAADMKVNPRQLWLAGSDPLKPNLKGYKQTVTPENGMHPLQGPPSVRQSVSKPVPRQQDGGQPIEQTSGSQPAPNRKNRPGMK